MLSARLVLTALAASGLATANQPQTTLRSVADGVSFQSAPATVACGGILTVVGTELAGAHTVAEGLPLPVSLEDPAVKVLINGVAAPLFFVSPTQINAQVPWETEPGWAEVVVRRGEAESAAMPVIVSDNSLSLIRHEGSSAPIAQSAAAGASSSLTLALGSPDSPPSATGDVLDASAAIAPGQTISIFASGVGETTPAIATGAAGAVDQSYSFVYPQRAFLGGIPVSDPSVDVSTEFVGIYRMTFTVPELAGATEAIHWASGNQVTSGLLGPVEAPVARYMAIPDGVESVERLYMPDLNPYYVAVSGALDETRGCYPDVQLLDFRRDTATAVSDCLLPSDPNAINPDRDYRPFEAAINSPALAAIVADPEDSSDRTTDKLLVIDSAAGTSTTITLDQRSDRLLPGAPGSPNLQLQRTGGEGLRDVIDLSGTVLGESLGSLPLPDPLEVDGLTRTVAQASATFAGGFRVRFLGPESADEIANSQAVLFDRSAAVVARIPFPDGWAPIAPPRRLNLQGQPTGGASLAPVSTGFEGDTTAFFVVARRTDGTQDGVVAFKVAVPQDPEADPPETASMTATVTPFPAGTFAASCTVAVRWLRVRLTQTLAIAGSGEALDAYAEPRDHELCASDRLVLFDTRTAEISAVSLPSASEKLDVFSRGVAGSYVYFGDGAREVAFEASQKIHVFDAVAKTFSEIALPDGAGLSFNNLLTQNIGGTGRLVALATGGSHRTNASGVAQAPYPGNRGLLVVDLPAGTATHLALPDGVQRAIPGNFRLGQQGRRLFGSIPLVGRAYGLFRRPNNLGGSAIVTWDIATGTATEIAMPEGGFAAVQAGSGGGPTFIWDYHGKTASFAFGVYNQAGSLISIGVVGP